MQFELISNDTRLFEFFKELISISTPWSPILFLLKFNLDILSVLCKILIKNLIEFIPKKLSDKSAIRFLHLKLQNSLNLLNIFSLKEIPISLHFELQNNKISSSANIGISSFNVLLNFFKNTFIPEDVGCIFGLYVLIRFWDLLPYNKL